MKGQSSRAAACAFLAKQETRLAMLLDKNGFPPIWERNPGFESLVRIILEQAVSLESAKAVFDKLKMEIGDVTPGNLITAHESVRSKTGFSRGKWNTCRVCAEEASSGSLVLNGLVDDENFSKQLLSIPGIGPWTVQIYLLLVVQREDIWPVADRALQVAVMETFCLPEPIKLADLMSISEPWRPYRSWAARILWHDYLIKRNRFT